MKETLVTISERTGFSITTISRVLSGNAEKHRISAKTIDIVTKEAKRCNYSPSLLAQSLRTNKTNTIGLILPSVSNPYFAEMSSVIITEAKSHNYTTIVMNSMEDVTSQNSSVSTLLSRRVDGIIAAPCGDSPSVFEAINDEYVPIVLVDRYFESSSLPYVTTDNYLGGMEATKLLLRNGHTNIACIQGETTSMPNARRVQGYRDALANMGLADNALVVGNDFSVQNGYLETKLLLNRSNRPTAIFALSNTIVLGTLKAIREASLTIPDDISVISFDNNIYLDYMSPAISRIGQPVKEMSKLATKLLFECIESKKHISTQMTLAPSMMSRESVSVCKIKK